MRRERRKDQNGEVEARRKTIGWQIPSLLPGSSLPTGTKILWLAGEGWQGRRCKSRMLGTIVFA